MINDRFLADKGLGEAALPFRLQKKALLKSLNFPLDPVTQIISPSDGIALNNALRFKLAETGNFLVVVSEMNAETAITPLLIVKGGVFIWRDHLGNKIEVDIDRALDIMCNLPYGTWLEIADMLWDAQTIGGRLLYESSQSQILEVQQALAAPSKLLDKKSIPTFVGNLAWLEIRRTDHQRWQKYLNLLGFESFLPYGKIRRLCRLFQDYFSGFEVLKQISPMPTIEFALRDGDLIVIDIDWPAQWIEGRCP